MLGPEDAASLSTIIPDGLDLFYKAVSLTKANQVLVTGSSLSSIMTTTGTCKDKMEGKCQARHFLHTELDCPPEAQYGVVRFMVLRVETPIMYLVNMQDMKIAGMYQKLALGLARHFAKAESRNQL
jgi:hypothetical protein